MIYNIHSMPILNIKAREHVKRLLNGQIKLQMRRMIYCEINIQNHGIVNILLFPPNQILSIFSKRALF